METTPLVLTNLDGSAWSVQCDVLVLGFGAAGACAALEAANLGADVLVCDRFDGGGASAKSGGIIYAGGGTPQQRAAGVSDAPQSMFDYLRQETGNVVSEATLRAFCQGSTAMIEWLTRLGVPFDATKEPNKLSYPRDGRYLYYSGNENAPAFSRLAPPAPRGHRVKGKGLSGKILFGFLRRAALQVGVRIHLQAAARRLITDVEGNVLGAEIRYLRGWASHLHRLLARSAELLHLVLPPLADALRRMIGALEAHYACAERVRARRGVIIATGGFVFNRTMLARYAPNCYMGAWRLGTTGCDGSGIRLGQSVGGDCAHMERISTWRFINPAWARGLIVDPDGRRIGNEALYGGHLGRAICERSNGRAWLILDARLRRAALRECVNGELRWDYHGLPALIMMLACVVKAADPAALAAKIGMSPERLLATLQDYNAMARGEIADTFDKSPAMRVELSHGPFYAIDISVDSKVFLCPTLTLGGLRVNEMDGAVVRADGRSISGLYAVGRAAVGIPSNNYVSGLSLADCIWSGRRAGRAVTLGPAEN